MCFSLSVFRAFFSSSSLHSQFTSLAVKCSVLFFVMSLVVAWMHRVWIGQVISSNSFKKSKKKSRKQVQVMHSGDWINKTSRIKNKVVDIYDKLCACFYFDLILKHIRLVGTRCCFHVEYYTPIKSNKCNQRSKEFVVILYT